MTDYLIPAAYKVPTASDPRDCRTFIVESCTAAVPKDSSEKFKCFACVKNCPTVQYLLKRPGDKLDYWLCWQPMIGEACIKAANSDWQLLPGESMIGDAANAPAVGTQGTSSNETYFVLSGGTDGDLAVFENTIEAQVQREDCSDPITICLSRKVKIKIKDCINNC